MFGAQAILKASQIVRTAVPARSIQVIAAPAKHKITKVEFLALCSFFALSNFAYPVYVLHYISHKRHPR